MTTNDTSVTVSRTIDASAKDLFDVLSNPQRHAELDGSGFVRSDEKTDRITATGQVFRMNMTGAHAGGDYQTDNHVTGYDKDKLLAWQTAPVDADPPGWQWVWQLAPQGPDSTDVTLTYDWSNVGDDFGKRVPFPFISETQLEDSLAKLSEAVSG